VTRRRTLQTLFCHNLLIGPATAALAQDLVIANARVFSAADASVVDGVNLVIRGDRIESISAGPVKVSGADVIDGAGLTMPGLIDAHLHLLLTRRARCDSGDAEAEPSCVTNSPAILPTTRNTASRLRCQ
jgi:imidazolonepropionase-like amidohydrolase